VQTPPSPDQLINDSLRKEGSTLRAYKPHENVETYIPYDKVSFPFPPQKKKRKKKKEEKREKEKKKLIYIAEGTNEQKR
jgi:hypothetical protein